MTEPQSTPAHRPPQLDQMTPIGLKGDYFIAWMIHHRRYSVDLITGQVSNPRSGRKLMPSPDKDGYQQVTLFFARGMQCTARVHRVVAIAGWGLLAVLGKEVGHRDHDKTKNHLGNLWLPDSPKEHFEFDGNFGNLESGRRKCKEKWEPCVRCGDPGGAPFHARVTPARVDGARFGIDGDICWRCYHALAERERRARKRGS